MNYLNEIDSWLEDRLRLVNASIEDIDVVIADVKRDIKGKILESYRNGQDGRGKRPSGVVKDMGRAVGREVVRQATEAPRQRKYTRKYTQAT